MPQQTDQNKNQSSIPKSIAKAIFVDLLGEYIALILGSIYFITFITALIVGYRFFGGLGFFIALIFGVIAALPAWKVVHYFDHGQKNWPKT